VLDRVKVGLMSPSVALVPTGSICGYEFATLPLRNGYSLDGPQQG
jgi:hypothetical protein